MTVQDNTFFNDDQSEIVLPAALDPSKDYLAELVGEGKKFQSPADLAKGKAESDLFIQRLQNENAEMRSKLKESSTIKALLDKMSEKPEPVRQVASPDGPKPEVQDKNKTEEIDLDKLLEKKFQERDIARTKDTNFNYIKNKLVDTWGDQYQIQLLAKAKELGVGPQFLDDLAKTQPNAFLKLLDVESAESVTQIQSLTSPPKSVVRTNPSGQNTKKNFAYYKNIKKTQGDHVYYSPRIQNEMMEQLTLQGDDFNKTI